MIILSNHINELKIIQGRLISVIYEKGRGWAFSRKDFVRFGEPDSIDQALGRMEKKGVIRRVMRGLYDYPIYSKLLKKQLSPDVDQVAHALARKFGWQIQVSGNAALNLTGLSTQVPTQYLYLSDGPSKVYQLGLKYTHNEILVQAVQALGDRALTQEEQQKLSVYLMKAAGVWPEVRASEESPTLSAWMDVAGRWTTKHPNKCTWRDDTGRSTYLLLATTCKIPAMLN